MQNLRARIETNANTEGAEGARVAPQAVHLWWAIRIKNHQASRLPKPTRCEQVFHARSATKQGVGCREACCCGGASRVQHADGPLHQLRTCGQLQIGRASCRESGGEYG